MELTEAIRNQKKGKSPGSDGFLPEYYQKFENIISNNLKNLISEIFDGAQLPDTWRYSTTTLIPKEGENKDDIKNYFPIALLNVDDYNFLWVNITERFRKIFSTLTHLDQNDFSPKRTPQKYIWTTLVF